jgi:hypothetical protein
MPYFQIMSQTKSAFRPQDGTFSGVKFIINEDACLINSVNFPMDGISHSFRQNDDIFTVTVLASRFLNSPYYMYLENNSNFCEISTNKTTYNHKNTGSSVVIVTRNGSFEINIHCCKETDTYDISYTVINGMCVSSEYRKWFIDDNKNVNVMEIDNDYHLKKICADEFGFPALSFERM